MVQKAQPLLHPFPASRWRKNWDATEEFLGCDGGRMGSWVLHIEVARTCVTDV